MIRLSNAEYAALIAERDALLIQRGDATHDRAALVHLVDSMRGFLVPLAEEFPNDGGLQAVVAQAAKVCL